MKKILFKLNTLSNLKSDEIFIQAATRCINLYRSALEKSFSMNLNPIHLESKEGETLMKDITEIEPLIEKYWNEGNSNNFAEMIVKLNHPIHDFFENNMIMVDDLKVRDSRLGLIKKLYKILIYGGDFSKTSSS